MEPQELTEELLILSVPTIFRNKKREYSLQGLISDSIPCNEAGLLNYLHTCNCEFETFLYDISNYFDEELEFNWTKLEKKRRDEIINERLLYCILYNKLFIFWITNRKTFKSTQKQLFWLIFCRINFIIHTISNGKDNNFYLIQKNHECIQSFIKHDLFVTHSPILWYSLKDIKGFIDRLASKFNNFFYSKELSYLVLLLHLSISKFLSFNNFESRYYDLAEWRQLKTNVTDQNRRYDINLKFIEDTDMYMFGFLNRLKQHEAFPVRCILKQENFDLQTCYSWVKGLFLVERRTFLEFIKEKSWDVIFLCALRVADVERNEKILMSDPGPSTIVGQFRNGEYKSISNYVARENFIEQTLKSFLTKKMRSLEEINKESIKNVKLPFIKSNQDEIDKSYINTRLESILMNNIQFETSENENFDIKEDIVFLLSVHYLLESYQNTSIKIDFIQNFVFFQEQIVFPLPLKISNNKYPIIIQTFNLFNVYYKQKLWIAKNAAIAFLYWIAAMCMDDSINGSLGEGAHLTTVFEILFPKLEAIILKLKKHNIKEISVYTKTKLPHFYPGQINLNKRFHD